MRPGFYEDMPEKQYRAFDALNYSTIAPAMYAPLLAKYRLDNPQPTTPAMRAGSRIHTCVLQPECWVHEYVVCPPIEKRPIEFTRAKTEDGTVWTWTDKEDGETGTGYKTKKAAEDACPLYTWKGNPGRGYTRLCDAKSGRGVQFAGRTIVTLAEQQEAFAIADAVEADPFAGDVLAASKKREFVVIWVDEVDGIEVLCKGRVDGYDGDRRMLWDLKTTLKEDARSFTNNCKYGYPYHAQIAYYARGCRLAAEQSGTEFPIDCCGFVAVNREPPHLVSTFMLTDESVRRGEAKARGALKRFVHARESGLWPGRYNEIITINP